MVAVIADLDTNICDVSLELGLGLVLLNAILVG